MAMLKWIVLKYSCTFLFFYFRVTAIKKILHLHKGSVSQDCWPSYFFFSKRNSNLRNLAVCMTPRCAHFVLVSLPRMSIVGIRILCHSIQRRIDFFKNPHINKLYEHDLSHMRVINYCMTPNTECMYCTTYCNALDQLPDAWDLQD